MNDKERREFINSIKENDLDKTATFSDLMSRAERRQHEIDKKRELELLKEKNLKKKEVNKKKKAQEEIKKKKIEKNLEKTKIIKSLNNNNEVKPTLEEKEVNNNNFFKSLIATTLFILSIGYFVYTLLFCDIFINQTFMIINSFIITLIALTNVLGLVKSISKSKFWILLNSLFVVILILFNLLVNLNILKLPTNNVVKDFTGVNINKAINWAEENNIKYYQVYEHSDYIEEFSVISQSVSPNTVVKNIKEIEFIVSKGPNLDKEVIISNMVGWNIDEVIKIIDDNFLSNVIIEYEFNEEIERDVVISQSISGQIRRNEQLKIIVSLGKEDELKPVEAISLINNSEFKATLWLKRNGIDYEIKYDFSNTIQKGYVMDQSISIGTIINQKKDKMIITVSKGSKIKVPDLKNMKVDEIINWVSTNNLKISFEERFDATVESGNVIESNYKKGDEIEEGTLIKIITSKGALKMKNFSSLSDFRTWASKYGVNINEVYEFNDSVEQGKIIKFSHEKDSVINYNDTVTVYISDGKAITVPSFYGKTKSNIQSTCSNLGLNCTFYYSKSSKTKDTAISQNKKAGSEVIKGTYVDIGLSGGASYGSSSSSSSSTNKPSSGGTSSSKPATPLPKTFNNIFIQTGWIGTADPTTNCSNIKNGIQSQTSTKVIINCTYKTSNDGRAKGKIHEESKYQANKSYTFTENQTYTFILVQ